MFSFVEGALKFAEPVTTTVLGERILEQKLRMDVAHMVVEAERARVGFLGPLVQGLAQE